MGGGGEFVLWTYSSICCFDSLGIILYMYVNLNFENRDCHGCYHIALQSQEILNRPVFVLKILKISEQSLDFVVLLLN